MLWVTPPNKSNVATIVFDKFGSKALPLFGVAFIRVLPLLGKPRKIPVYALIRSVASIRQLSLFGQKRTLVKINNFGSRNVPKMAKKGVIFFRQF